MMEALAILAGVLPAQECSTPGANSRATEEITPTNSVGDGLEVGVSRRTNHAYMEQASPTKEVRSTTSNVDALGTDITLTKLQCINTTDTPVPAASGADVHRGEQEEDSHGLLELEWLWSGPLLPCHYRVRQYLAGDSGATTAKYSVAEILRRLRSRPGDAHEALSGAIAELREVNLKLGDDTPFSP